MAYRYVFLAFLCLGGTLQAALNVPAASSTAQVAAPFTLCRACGKPGSITCCAGEYYCSIACKNKRSAQHGPVCAAKVDKAPLDTFVDQVEKNNKSAVKESIARGININLPESNGFYPLFVAVQSRSLDCVKLLIAAGADISRGHGGFSPLHVATEQDDITILRMLLSVANINAINAVNNAGATPLFEAAMYGHADCLQALIKAGADINKTDTPGNSPLHIACFNAHEACARLLLEHGATINTADTRGNSPLLAAIYKKQEACARLLIERGADVNGENNDGSAPLLMTISENFIPGLHLLLAHKADVNKSNNQGFLPVTIAAQHNKYEALQLLIKHGATIRGLPQEQDPMHQAACKGHTACLALLIEAGALKDQPTEYLFNLARTAVAWGQESCLRLLIEQGALLHHVAAHGVTLPFIAAQEGRAHCLSLLLAHGVDARVRCGGYTPLDSAVHNNQVDCIDLLIREYKKDTAFDLNKETLDDDYLLIYALKNKLTGAALCLLDHGATHRIADKEGITAFEWACKTWNEAAVKKIVPDRDPNHVIAEYFATHISGTQSQRTHTAQTATTSKDTQDDEDAISDGDCDTLNASAQAPEDYEDDLLFAKMHVARTDNAAPATTARHSSKRSVIHEYHERVAQWFINPEDAFAKQGYCTPSHPKYTGESEKTRVIQHHTFPRIIDDIVTAKHCIAHDDKKRVYRVYGKIIRGRTIEHGSFTYAVAKKRGIGCYHRSFSHAQQLATHTPCIEPDAELLAKLQANSDAARYIIRGQKTGILIVDKTTNIMYHIFLCAPAA